MELSLKLEWLHIMNQYYEIPKCNDFKISTDITGPAGVCAGICNGQAHSAFFLLLLAFKTKA